MSGNYETILFDLGRKNLQNNKIDDAIIVFKRLINSQNKVISSKAYYYLAKCFDFKGDYELAIKNIKNALKNNNEEERYLFLYGKIQMKRKIFSDAIEAFLQIPNIINPSIYFDLSQCYFRCFQYEKALVCINNSIQRNSMILIENFLLKFEICFKLGDFSEVEKDILKHNFLNIFEDNRNVVYYAIMSLCEQNKEDFFTLLGSFYRKYSSLCNFAKAKWEFNHKNYSQANKLIDLIPFNEGKNIFSFFYVKASIKKEINENIDIVINNYELYVSSIEYIDIKSIIEFANYLMLYEKNEEALDVLGKMENILKKENTHNYGFLIFLKKAELILLKFPQLINEAKKKIEYIREELRKDKIRQSYTNKDIIEIYSKYLELNSYYYGYTLQDLIVYPEQLLGEGRTTKVYKGILKQEEVAAKFYKLNKDFLINEQYTMNILEHIFLEVTSMEIINTRRNQYILPIKCVFYLNNRKLIYLITPLCKGGSLYQLLHNINLRRNINFEHQIIVMLKIAEAVHFFHHFSPPTKVNILKSKSILFKDVYSSTKLRVNICLGNISHIGKIPTDIRIDSAYLSPEIIEKKDIIDEKSDIYSFGVLLWEMFSGNDPSLGLSSNEIIEKVKNKKFCLPIEEMSSSHQRTNYIATLAIECLNEDKDKRPSIEEIISILKELPDEDILRDNLL